MLKQKYFIDSHKGATPLFIIALISYFNQWNNVYALLYLALHGTYGILWMAKSRIFPDKQWEQKISIWYGLTIWVGLSLYWIAPYIITTNQHFLPFEIRQNSLHICCCVMIYIFGIFLHFTSDMQKYVSLKLNPGHLITDGMFSRVRNTNYLGELFIYLGFTLLSRDFLPVLALLAFFLFLWIPNMIKKDKSLSRYSEFESYKNRTSKMFPFLF